MKFYTVSADETLGALNSAREGLSDREAAQRLEQ